MSRPRRRRRRWSNAFTSVELLVVTAILGVLVSIVLPAIGRARAKSREVGCAANLRSLGQAAAMYSTGFNGWLPRDAFSASDAFFAPHLARALGQAADETTVVVGTRRGARVQMDMGYCAEWLRQRPAFHCPAVTDRTYPLHYVVNAVDFQWHHSTGLYRSRPWQKALAGGGAGVGYLFEADMAKLPPDKLGQFNVSGTPDLPYHVAPHAEAGRPTAAPRMIAADDRRHGGRSSVLFFDGHVESRDLRSPGDWPASLLSPYRR